MAHVGEKARPGDVRRLGLVLGQPQLRRAALDLLPERRPVLAQLVVTRRDLAEHAVEAGDQFADFVAAVGQGHAQRVIALARHLPHGLCQFADRLRDGALQAPRQHERAGECNGGTGHDQHSLRDVRPHRRQIGFDRQRTDDLAALPDRVLDAQRRSPVGTDHLWFRNTPLARGHRRRYRRMVREHLPAWQGDRRLDELWTNAQAGECLGRRARVVEGDRRRGAGGQHFGHAGQLGEFGRAVVVDLGNGEQERADQQAGTCRQCDDQHQLVPQRQVAKTQHQFLPFASERLRASCSRFELALSCA
ncbi:MAG: hypothetical protein AW07_02970 [Candidatus Accumulibacter sp. SK-11]|nr:MAG: hypothetical protein AW07_02970 [Candidatus Accumulibacter sp. SK-11]